MQIEHTGVLGEGQGVDYYSGIRIANGNVFEDGYYPTKAMGYNDIYIIDLKQVKDIFESSGIK